MMRHSNVPMPYIMTLTLPRPIDAHLHLRDDAWLGLTVPHAALSFERALVMPNLVPPVTTVEQALLYRARILEHVPQGVDFKPLMLLYLTDTTSPDTVAALAAHPDVLGFKLYPQGATTHSDAGVKDIQRIFPILECMEKHDVPLLIHGESILPEIDVFDRERVFIEETLRPIISRFPALRIVLEHISTAFAAQFIAEQTHPIAATITAHHLHLNRNDLLVGGLKPHHYCLPVVKRETDRQALIDAALSGSPKFFLGTDSAPHAQEKKESACGCAGIYTSYSALPLYAEVFEAHNALDKLPGFVHDHAVQFYGLTPSTQTVTLTKTPHVIPEQFMCKDMPLIPFQAGHTLSWSLA